MEKLEVIRVAHLIDHHLGALLGTVTDEALEKRIAAVRAEWQGLAYAITAHACGVEHAHGVAKKKASRKRSDGLAQQDARGVGEAAPPATDSDHSPAPTETLARS